MQWIDQYVKSRLLHAAQQAVEADKHRDVVFKAGDLVWLKTSKLKLKKGVGVKLIPRYLGPYEVEAVAGDNAYKLKLPPTLHCRRTWNVSYLRPHVASDQPLTELVADQQFSLLDLVDEEQPVQEDTSGVREVEEYHFNKMTRAGREFKVRFKGGTWAEAEDMRETDLAQLPGHADAWKKWLESVHRPSRR